jgi:ferredoxin-NADP reductase
MKLTFIGSETREGDARTFKFKPESPLSWQAGQYIHYRFPHSEADDRGVERWFTISAAPHEGVVTITTRINHEHSSSFKKALQELKPGDTIEADEPEGDFVVFDESRNYIFVAGGIGITPFRSILVEAAHQGKQLHVNLLYSNRDENIVFKDELDKLAEQNPNLKITYIVQPERLEHDRLQQEIASVNSPLVYISGPEPMVEALTAEVAQMGVTEYNIRSDYFPGYTAY